MTNWYIENKKESGLVLWAMAPCGRRQPIMRWPCMEEMRMFAQWLMDYHDSFTSDMKPCRENANKDIGDRASVDKLLREALGDDYPAQ